MKKLSTLIEEHLQQNNLDYDEKGCTGADHGYLIAYRGSNVGMLCGIKTYDDQIRLSITVFSGAKAQPERLRATYELVARLNNDIAMGAFRVDSDGGDVSYNLGASALGARPTDKWIGSLICTSLYLYNYYFPTIANVLYAGADPVEAIAMIGGPSDAEVTESVAKLLSDADEAPEQSAAEKEPLNEAGNLWDGGGESDEQEDREDEESSDSPDATVRLPRLPRIIPRIAPQDMEDVLREIRGEDRQGSENQGQTGGQDEAAA